MAWNDLAPNQMVSFNDIQESNFTLKAGQTAINTDQCITKLQALTMYNVNPLAVGIYASNQLIPKSDIQVNGIILCYDNTSALNACEQCAVVGPEPPPDTSTENSFIFDADSIIMTYRSSDGQDLDILVRVVTPNIGQTSRSTYIGFPGDTRNNEVWPKTGTPILTWGGDNLGTGFEAVYLNVARFKQLYPSENTIVVDLRCLWYTTVGTQPVNIAATMYKGGTVQSTGHSSQVTGFNFTNTGFTDSRTINSVSKVITNNTRGGSGERLVTLTYNITTGIGTFNAADTTTPSV